MYSEKLSETEERRKAAVFYELNIKWELIRKISYKIQ